MANLNLKIRIYKTGQAKPETVVTIPLTVVRIATRLLPKKAKLALKEEGIEVPCSCRGGITRGKFYVQIYNF